MIRTACALIVLSMAGAPTDALFCLVSCADDTQSMPAAAACQSAASLTPTMAPRHPDRGVIAQDAPQLFARTGSVPSAPQPRERGAPVRNRSPVLRI